MLEQHRLTRAQFERFFDNRSVSRMIMEACGSAHHWARVFGARGIEVTLLPAMYVRAYVRRSKTDATDALALLEAAELHSPKQPIGDAILLLALLSVNRRADPNYLTDR